MEAFRICIPDSQLRDLQARLSNTRWIPTGKNTGWEEGVPLSAQKELIDYWQNQFDWRKQEAWLNEIPQFKTKVSSGETLHFMYQKGGANAKPLLICHGWPGSFVEMREIIEYLTTEKDGLSFDVVVPSMPGYGFSSYEALGPVNLCTIGDMYDDLMHQLGYSEYYVQGGDWGAQVTCWMAKNHPESVKAFHLNFLPGSYMPDTASLAATPEEKAFLARKQDWMQIEGGYDYIQATKPLTVSAALNDSPAGLAAWIFEKFYGWSDWENAFGKHLTLDKILTNISVYWFTNSIYSSARVYMEAEKKKLHLGPGERILPPMGFTRFPHEISSPPRSWLERVFQVRSFTEAEMGGHFAAMEQPEIVERELRNFFGSI